MRAPRYDALRTPITPARKLPKAVRERMLLPTHTLSTFSKPTDPYEKGMDAYNRNDFRGAVKHFTTAIRDLEKFERTTPVYRDSTGNLVDMSPQAIDLPYAYYNRALAYEQLDQGRRALADYKRAAAIIPDSFDRTYLDERIKELSIIHRPVTPQTPKR